MYLIHKAREIKSIEELYNRFSERGDIIEQVKLVGFTRIEGDAMDNSLVKAYYKKSKEKSESSSTNVEKTTKTKTKSSGNGLMWFILFLIGLVFVMAYMASVYDIKEEDYWANYDTLGLPADATITEVKKRYRDLSRK